MSLRPIYGHESLRWRLASSWHAGRLPASLLFQGTPGVGKQRLALWLGQLQVCEVAQSQGLFEPCGACQQCRYALRGVHPDVHWTFPRPRLKDSDPSADAIAADMADAIGERLEQHNGLWAGTSGSEGLHVATMRAVLHQATLRPAMARHSTFIVGEADRMVSQEGADQAANAFLKLLEEPPPHATFVLTTSEPGALLPTIRSRVATVRVAPVSPAAVAAFLSDSAVVERVIADGKGGARRSASGSSAAASPQSSSHTSSGDSASPAISAHRLDHVLATAGGSPGAALAILAHGDGDDAPTRTAATLLDAALQPSTPAGRAQRAKVAARLGVAGARGAFSDALDAMTALLHAHTKSRALTGAYVDARRSAQAMHFVERAKQLARGNVSPQLVGADLIQQLHRTLVHD